MKKMSKITVLTLVFGMIISIFIKTTCYADVKVKANSVTFIFNPTSFATLSNFIEKSNTEIIDVYVAGTFNSWNKRNDRFKLEKKEEKWFKTIELQKGTYEFKYVIYTGNEFSFINNNQIELLGTLDYPAWVNEKGEIQKTDINTVFEINDKTAEIKTVDDFKKNNSIAPVKATKNEKIESQKNPKQIMNLKNVLVFIGIVIIMISLIYITKKRQSKLF